MDYKKQLNSKIKIYPNINILIFKKIKEFYKKRPGVLLVNIILIVVGYFVAPIISLVVGLLAIFILPNWKEKVIK
jgi:hypothetical protein